MYGHSQNTQNNAQCWTRSRAQEYSPHRLDATEERSSTIFRSDKQLRKTHDLRMNLKKSHDHADDKIK